MWKCEGHLFQIFDDSLLDFSSILFYIQVKYSEFESEPLEDFKPWSLL